VFTGAESFLSITPKGTFGFAVHKVVGETIPAPSGHPLNVPPEAELRLLSRF
jgi:hypothetical protein